MAKVQKYITSGMDAKKVVVDKEIDNSSIQDSVSSITTFPITASDSGITTVPMPILQAMFDKGSKHLRKRDNVIPKPGQPMDHLLSPEIKTLFMSLHLERVDV